MPQFFSQNGEDCLLWELFKSNKSPGFYVEVGALDGVRYSNTYLFEREGWNGICVEAHPMYIELVRKNRPRSTNVFAAVGNENKAVTFYTNARGSLSTLNPELEDEFRARFGTYFSGFEPVQVQMQTLTTIFDEANAPKTIDILSIDIEGADLLALEGIDFNKYQIRTIVVEANDTEEKEKITAYLTNVGYEFCRSVSNNLFFCRDKTDSMILARAKVNCTLTHVPHILDKDAQPLEKSIVLSPVQPSAMIQVIIRRIRALWNLLN